MNKFFSFTAGALCGLAVGVVVALLLAPASGSELTGEAQKRWQEAVAEAHKAQAETRSRLEMEYQQLRLNGRASSK